MRFSSIGDIVLTTPLVRALRRRFPAARLDFAIKQEFAELMQTNPHLTTVYGYDKRSGMSGLLAFAQQLRRNRYDLFVDLHNNFRSYLLRFLTLPAQIVSYAKQILRRTLFVQTGLNRYGKIFQMPERYLQAVARLGVVNDAAGLELFPTEAHWAKVAALFRQANLEDSALAIGFGPVAAHPLKQWPVERYIELAQQLVQRENARILLFGGPADVSTVSRMAAQIPHAPIVLCGNLSLLESAAAIRRCAVFVGNDTGTIHLAAAMQRKVVVLFGPTVEEFGYYPYRTPAQVISKPLSCRPCTHTGKGVCKIKTHACMATITPAEVFEAVEKMLKV